MSLRAALLLIFVSMAAAIAGALGHALMQTQGAALPDELWAGLLPALAVMSATVIASLLAKGAGWPLEAILGSVLGVVGAVGAALVIKTQGRLLDAAMLFVLGLITAALVALLPRLFHADPEHSRAALDPSWGTLGGDNPGYSLSPTASLLLIVIMGVLTIAALGYESKPVDPVQIPAPAADLNLD